MIGSVLLHAGPWLRPASPALIKLDDAIVIGVKKLPCGRIGPSARPTMQAQHDGTLGVATHLAIQPVLAAPMVVQGHPDVELKATKGARDLIEL